MCACVRVCVCLGHGHLPPPATSPPLFIGVPFVVTSCLITRPAHADLHSLLSAWETRSSRLRGVCSRFSSFNELLDVLTSNLPGTAQLPYGVRQLFDPLSGRRLRDVAALRDGAAVVCAGFEAYKREDYGSIRAPPSWGAGGGGEYGVCVCVSQVCVQWRVSTQCVCESGVRAVGVSTQCVCE